MEVVVELTVFVELVVDAEVLVELVLDVEVVVELVVLVLVTDVEVLVKLVVVLDVVVEEDVKVDVMVLDSKTVLVVDVVPFARMLEVDREDVVLEVLDVLCVSVTLRVEDEVCESELEVEVTVVALGAESCP